MATISILNKLPHELQKTYPGAEHFSIWLMPTKSNIHPVQNIIESVAVKRKMFNFELHLSLYTGLMITEDELKKSLNLVNDALPISITLGSLRFSNNFFKSAYFDVYLKEGLQRLNENIIPLMCLKDHYSFEPHISITYGRCNVCEKNYLIKTLLPYSGTEIVLTEAAVIVPGAKGWKDISAWKIKYQE